MKKRIWPIMSILVTVCLLLLSAGCQPTSPATPSEPVKITILVGFGTGTEQSQIDLHNQLAQQFNSSHPDIQVEFVTVAYEEHVSKFTTMIAGEMAPDIVMPIGVMGVAEFNDAWLDIKPYIDRDNYDTSDYYGPALQLQTYTDRVIGLPIGVYPTVTFYNEDLFDEAGLDYPPHQFGDVNWTYDKLVELAQKLTLDSAGNDATSADFNADDIAQWGWDGWDWSPWRIIPGKFGGNPLGVSADYKTAEMTAQPWVDGMQFLSDAIWEYHIHPTGEVIDAAFSEVDPLQSGQVAMWEVFSWMAYNYSTWSSAFNWDVAAVPAGPDGKVVTPANGDVFAITKASKHPDQAWEVAKWLMEPEIMEQLAKSYGCIPARKSLADGWLESMNAEYPDVDFQVFIDSIEYMDANPNNEGWVPNYSKVWDAMENAMSLVVTGENTNVEEVLSNLNTEVQGYLDEYWAQQK